MRELLKSASDLSLQYLKTKGTYNCQVMSVRFKMGLEYNERELSVLRSEAGWCRCHTYPCKLKE